MPSSRTPNKSRFLEAATIYRDAMVPFIDGVLGSDRTRSHLFSDEARKRNEDKYNEGMRSLRQGTPVRNLIDQADIPFLIEDNLRHFSGLDRADVSRMHQIRLLWNDKIKHRDELGDFAPEDAAEYATHCARVLRRCGFDDDADAVIGTSSSEAAEAVTASDLREQRERREWDKERLAGKSPEELTQWEQQRLNEIEWEEEWERRELVRSEREAIAAFGDDIGGLRIWFNADEARRDRHPSEHVTLPQREREISEIAQIGGDIDRLGLWFGADEERKARHPATYKRFRKRWLRRQEQEISEIAQIAGDIDRLGLWFGADKDRKGRYPATYEMLQDENQRRQKREISKIAQIGGDIDRLRRWFDADKGRRQRHPSEYAGLLPREQERREQYEREQRNRERREEREQKEQEPRAQERREQEQHRSPSGAVHSESRTDDAPPKRSLLSRIFRR